MQEQLITKYRPQKMDQVIGHEIVKKSLLSQFDSQARPHVYIFTGSSGVGKTTLARVFASALGCYEPETIKNEINAGAEGGVDKMRTIIEQAAAYSQYANCKAYIIDECHALTPQALNALLKAVEESPDHVYWFFLTTEETKIKEALQTRCVDYLLEPLHVKELFQIAKLVATEEQMTLTPELLFYICNQSGGSARQLIKNLSKCRACTTLEEVQQLAKPFANSITDPGTNSFAQLLMKGSVDIGAYQAAINTVADVKGAKYQLKAYFAKVQQSARTNVHLIKLVTVCDSINQLPDTPSKFDLWMVVYRIWHDIGYLKTLIPVKQGNQSQVAFTEDEIPF